LLQAALLLVLSGQPAMAAEFKVTSVWVVGVAGLDYSHAGIDEAYESYREYSPSEEVSENGKTWKIIAVGSNGNVLQERTFDYKVVRSLAKCKAGVDPCKKGKTLKFALVFPSKGEIAKVRLYKNGKLLQEKDVDRLK
jgi:hypothetical protein